jgi:heme/copper-type cytochrome/quinol oxidase subunit 4
MWEQYRRTMIGMQLSIALMTLASYMLMYRHWQPALLFFITMQAGSVAGAFWATRLKRRFPGRT